MSSHLRTVPFEYETRSDDGDGLTLEGYAAVYNEPTPIRDWLGEYTEVIRPGAADRSLRERTPVLQFDHGKHPLVGSIPLGVGDWSSDERGLHVQARLSPNWLIQPVRDAIADRAITGMSFRFSVPKGGELWDDDETLREILDMDVYEGGPVVFPAYDATTVGVRDYTGGAIPPPSQQPATVRDEDLGTPPGGDGSEPAEPEGDAPDNPTMTPAQARAALLGRRYRKVFPHGRTRPLPPGNRGSHGGDR